MDDIIEVENTIKTVIKVLGFKEDTDFIVGFETYDMLTAYYDLIFSDPLTADELSWFKQALDNVLGEENFLGKVNSPTHLTIAYKFGWVYEGEDCEEEDSVEEDSAESEEPITFVDAEGNTLTLYDGSDDDDEDYGVYLGATAENTLCIETTLTHFDQLEGGDGQIFSRRLDMDNYKQFLECDADGCPKHCSWANDKLKALQDKMDVLTFCNDGDCPLMPKKGIEWVRFTVGEKLVYAELIRCQFEPATDPETGKMVRYDYDESGNKYYTDEGRHCYWRILFSVTQPRYIEG